MVIQNNEIKLNTSLFTLPIRSGIPIFPLLLQTINNFITNEPFSPFKNENYTALDFPRFLVKIRR